MDYSIELINIIENQNITNDNILILLEKLDQLLNIQFNTLVLALVIVILVVIYSVVKKFLY